jgi:hypothetical protein
VSDVAAANFVGGTDGNTASRTRFRTKVALFLDDNDDAVA